MIACRHLGVCRGELTKLTAVEPQDDRCFGSFRAGGDAMTEKHCVLGKHFPLRKHGDIGFAPFLSQPIQTDEPRKHEENIVDAVALAEQNIMLFVTGERCTLENSVDRGVRQPREKAGTNEDGPVARSQLQGLHCTCPNKDHVKLAV